jgi:hypothetical protein
MKALPLVRLSRFLSALAVALITWRMLSTAFRLQLTDVVKAEAQLPVLEKAKQNSTLVIIMGNLRGGEQTWKTLYEQVLDVNQADLALMIGKANTTKNSSSLYRRAKYLWEFDEYEDWADALDLINGTAWRETVPRYLNESSSILGGVKLYHYEGSGAVIFMLRWFLSQEIQRQNLTQRYDRFVVTRSDHYYLCEHNLSELDPQYLWLPRGQNFGGVTDRHLVVNAENLLPALDILPALLAHPERYPKLLADRRGNPERMILQRWRDLKLGKRVKRFKRMMFTCAADGDMTRWNSMSDFVVPEGVHLKYQKEYNQSHATCGATKEIQQ